MSEDAGHGCFEGSTEFKFVETEEAAVGIHEAVVVHHGCHDAGGEGVAVDEGDGRHGVAGKKISQVGY